MKLQQLPLGARFEYEGQTYTKTGPITASGEDGANRMIPRYAVLKPLDGRTPAVSSASRKLDEAAVLAAFEAFHQVAAGLAGEAGREELAAAREHFLAALK